MLILKFSVYTPSKNELTESVIRCVCNALIENSDILNELDSKIGDGDTGKIRNSLSNCIGTTFAQASRRILDNMSSLPLDNPSQLALKIGDLLSLVMGGSSGVLLSIFFTAAGNSMKNENSWSKSNLQAGLDAIMKYGGGMC